MAQYLPHVLFLNIQYVDYALKCTLQIQCKIKKKRNTHPNANTYNHDKISNDDDDVCRVVDGHFA